MKGTKYTPNMALMVKPLNFNFNEETKHTNSYQHELGELERSPSLKNVGKLEFNNLVKSIFEADMNMCVLSENETKDEKPDAVFSNNWVVYMPNGKTYTMPMYASNRKQEVDHSLILGEADDKFVDSIFPLEGTGSMVFDHINKKIYATRSPRTSIVTLGAFSKEVGYQLISFDTNDGNSNPIYHTNVMMSVGEKWAIVCEEVIEPPDRDTVLESLKADGKEIISISKDQMENFCANVLELRNSKDDLIISMSTQAWSSYNLAQIKAIGKYCKFCKADIRVIEEIGGGSARCMITGLFV